ncbi:lysozyme-like [Varroa destructor]|uniref:lysozyme n=1 Tax=Varroa destructor TaxID=109461 RepID=A0A7M7J9C4_VARDE|nr:lysozyme-like [Varroa destructor]XP_022648599.1 lysozyme-like [Varroa destructor]
MKISTPLKLAVTRSSWTTACFVMVYVLTGLSAAQDDATKKCLDCICYASTKCIANAPCDGYCGPFQISEAYWIDAGRPGGTPGYAQCAINRSCAEDTIISYMNKFGTDCDGDAQVTCDDYARMHKAGRGGCSAPWVLDTPYWTQYTQCMQGGSSG